MAIKTTAEKAADVQPEKLERKKTREFIGRAWRNQVNVKGKDLEVLNLSLDNKVAKLTIEFEDGDAIVLGADDRITLWPNDKREGRKDADFRASVALN